MAKRFIIINSHKYDITEFKHPGGNVINYMTNGENATEEVMRVVGLAIPSSYYLFHCPNRRGALVSQNH